MRSRPFPAPEGKRPWVRQMVVMASLCALLTVLVPTASAGEWDSENWDRQVVDSFGGLSTNSGLSVDVDSKGRPHVAYYALKGADLRYAVRTGAGWQTETVDDHQVVGPDCSLVLDDDDVPHICYYDRTNEELEYARRNGTGWVTETVDWLGIVGVGTSIAVGPGGDPYVAYVGARTLRCAHREAGNWNVTVVDGGEQHVHTPSMLVDGGGVPHVLYLGAGTVKHAYRVDGNWTLEEVDMLRLGTFAMGTSLRIGPGGELVACYANDAATSVVLARRTGDGWDTERVSVDHYLGDLDMELDDQGDPHIALIDLAFDSEQQLVNTDVWYLELEGANWTRGVVMGSEEHHGILLDLYLDGGDGPCLALVDVDPIATEADLDHFSGWSGEHIEAYTGEEAGDGADGGEGEGSPGARSSMVILAVVVLAVVVLLAIYGMVWRGGAEG